MHRTDDSVRLNAAQDLQVISRSIRLPTRSVGRARSIVRLQLDRLSPIPADETIFDLQWLRADGTDQVFGLAMVRRSSLGDTALGAPAKWTVQRTVDGALVTFVFRNGAASADHERRLLRFAPQAAAIGLAVTAVLLAAELRADRWRDSVLPLIAAKQRAAHQTAREASERSEAQKAWTSLDRNDAATQYFCILGQLGSPSIIGVERIQSDADKLVLTLSPSQDTARFAAAGGTIEPGAQGSTVSFNKERCE